MQYNTWLILIFVIALEQRNKFLLGPTSAGSINTKAMPGPYLSFPHYRFIEKIIKTIDPGIGKRIGGGGGLIYQHLG